MEYYDFFRKWEKRVNKSIGVDKLKENENDYIGFFQAKDIGELTKKFMGIWVQKHPIKQYNRNDAIGEMIRKFNNENLDNQYKERFVTKKEFSEIFSERLGLKLDSYINSAKTEEGSSTSVVEAYEDFYSLHPVYGLFDIIGERDRRKYEPLCEEEDTYFYAMDAVNKTLGNFFFALRRFRIPDKAREGHTYIVGSSGSGKSELIKSLANVHMMQGRSSVIIIDPNGDLAEEIGMFKENLLNPENLVYIEPNLFEQVRKGEEIDRKKPVYIPIINLFDIDTINMADGAVKKITLAIFEAFVSIAKEAGDGNTNYTSNMKNVIVAGIQLMLEHKEYDFWDLVRLMEDDTNADLIEMGKKSKYDEVRLFFNKKIDLPRYKTARQGVGTRLDRIIAMGVAKYITGDTSIDLEKAMDSKKTIIFNLAKGGLGSEPSRIYGQFILAHILSIGFARSNQKKKDRVPCHVYIDEFHNYASEKLKETFKEGRKFKIFLTVATQVKDQDLSRDMARTIMGNTGVKIIGSSARDTRVALSKEMELTSKDISELTGVSQKTLKQLKIGEFVVQVGNNGLPFKMINRRRTLDTKNAMTKKQWKEILQQQKSLYYVEKKKLTDDKMFGKENTQGNSGNEAENGKTRTEPKDLNSKFKL